MEAQHSQEKPTENIDLLTAEELREKKEKLLEEERDLDRKIQEFQFTPDRLQAEMQALHRYNDIKDVAQSVLGYLADMECTTITEMHQRFNLPLD